MEFQQNGFNTASSFLLKPIQRLWDYELCYEVLGIINVYYFLPSGLRMVTLKASVRFSYLALKFGLYGG